MTASRMRGARAQTVKHDASHLQEHFEDLVPFGYENDCGGFGDVVLDVAARKVTVERTTDSKTTRRPRTRCRYGASTQTRTEQREKVRWEAGRLSPDS